MAVDKYAVVRLDRVTGTTDGSKLLSGRFYDGNDPADIENGNIVHITTTLLDREVFKTTVPTASDTIKTIGLVASVEIVRDNLLPIDALGDFINKADGEAQRVYLLESGDIFSVTAKAISGLPVGGSGKGGIVKIGASTKWVYAASGNDAVGDIIDVETIGTKKYYVIRIR